MAGMVALERAGFSDAVVRAFEAITERDRELGRLIRSPRPQGPHIPTYPLPHATTGAACGSTIFFRVLTG